MLLCVLSHPTQYDPPLWNAMARDGRLKTVVWYASATPPDDQEMKQRVGWSAQGAEFEHRNIALHDLPRAFLTIRKELDAVIVPGWVHPITRMVLPLARAFSVPVITSTDKTLNDPSYKPPVDTAATAFHVARTRLFQGFFTTGLLGEQYLVSLGLPREAIARGLYPIDVNHWQAAMAQDVPLARELKSRFSDRRFILLSVCKLVDRESPLDVLRAFAKVRKRRSDVALIHVGDGPLRAQYEAEVQRLGLGRDVALPGYVKYSELPAFYAVSSAFIHVARYEPWGISVLEAMACGLPVIAATTVGSAADLVVHGRTGALAYQGDTESIAEAIQLVADRNEPEAMGSAAKAAVATFDVHRAGENVRRLVARLQQPHRAASLGEVAHSHLRNQFGRWHME